jgi:hypothetical protein
MRDVEARRANGETYAAIARAFNAEGRPTITGVGTWTSSNVRLFDPTLYALPDRVANQLPAAAIPAAARPAEYLMLPRTFGVEVEYTGHVGQYDLSHYISRDGVPATYANYGHAVPTDWKVTSDGTCSGEVVSPILSGDASLDTLRSVLRTMKAAGCGTGQAASVHVHIGLLDFDADAMTRLVDTLRHTDLALMAYVADSRLNNQWCRPMQAREWDELSRRASSRALLPKAGRPTASHATLSQYRDGSTGVSRYKRYNFNSVLVYGTVEFRAHAASLNILKLRPWIAVTTALVEYAARGYSFTTEQTVDSMLAELLAKGLITTKVRRDFKAETARRDARASGHRRRYIPAHIVQGAALAA